MSSASANDDPVRQIDIHLNPAFETVWLGRLAANPAYWRISGHPEVNWSEADLSYQSSQLPRSPFLDN